MAWAWLCPSLHGSSARLGMIGSSISVPRHYPGTLSQAGSLRSQHNVGVSWRRSRLYMWFETENYRDGWERVSADGLVPV